MRIQHIIWVLLLLSAFLAVVWFCRPPRVKIESYLCSSDDQSEAKASRDFDRAMEANSIVKSDEFIKSIVTDPIIAQTELIRDLDAPAQWLKEKLASVESTSLH